MDDRLDVILLADWTVDMKVFVTVVLKVGLMAASSDDVWVASSAGEKDEKKGACEVAMKVCLAVAKLAFWSVFLSVEMRVFEQVD